MKNNKGYILYLNLIIITLIGLFIPLLIQQHQINLRITNNRKEASQNKAAVEAGIEYQLYLLKEEILVEKKLELKEDLKIKIKGEEGDNLYYLKSELEIDNSYLAEVIVEKGSLKIITKKLYRGD